MKKLIAIDFETYLISNEAPAPKPVCVSYHDGETTGLLTGGHMQPFLKQLLIDHTIIAHNAKFELTVIYEHFPELRNLVWKAVLEGRILCTKIYETLIQYRKKKPSKQISLGALVQNYLGIDILSSKNNEDAWRLRYDELEGIPVNEWPQEAVEYAKNDSVYTYKIFKIQSDVKCKLKQHVQADFALALMANRGMLIDLERVNQIETEVQEILRQPYEYLLKEEVYREDKGQVKKGLKQLQQYIKDNFKSCKYTAKRKVSTTHDHLIEYLLEKSDPVIEAHAKVMEYEKVNTTFLKTLKTANPFIRTQYNPIVSTGRTSSSGSSIYPSLNIQQQPRTIKGLTWDIRNCYIPRPGKVFCTIDYAGLELATAANQLYKLFGWSRMLKTLNEGDGPVDMHSKLAVVLRNAEGKYPRVSYEEFVANKKKPTFKEYRQLAKPINLGFPGGIGYDTMALLLAKDGIKLRVKVIKTVKSTKKKTGEELLMPTYLALKAKGANDIRIRRVSHEDYELIQDELVLIKHRLFELYPDLHKFLKHDHQRFLMTRNGDHVFKSTKNEFGEWEQDEMYEYETTGFKRTWCTYTALCNGYLMQTPGASGAKQAVVDCVKYCETQSNGEAQALAFIHDELIFEIDEKMAQYHGTKLAEIMIDSLRKVLPYPRITVEMALQQYWSKDKNFLEKTLYKNPNSNELKIV